MTPSEEAAPPHTSAAFLLTQLGTHAARAFAERIAVLDLTPPQAGLLRLIARDPGRSQQALATQLGTPPTRLVALVDDLEQRGLVQRKRNPSDRRLHAVHLTEHGGELMGDIGTIAREHDDAVVAALDPDERAQLRQLLSRLAADHGLAPEVHPGYRALGEPPATDAGDGAGPGY